MIDDLSAELADAMRKPARFPPSFTQLVRRTTVQHELAKADTHYLLK